MIYIYIYKYDINMYTCMWLAAVDGKGTEWTRPASQPGYTTQGTENRQQNRRWIGHLFVFSEFPSKCLVDIWLVDVASTQLYLASLSHETYSKSICPLPPGLCRTLTLGGSTPGWEPARGGSDKCKVRSYLQPHLTWQCLLEKKYRYSTIAVFTLARAARWNIGLVIRSWSCPCQA